MVAVFSLHLIRCARSAIRLALLVLVASAGWSPFNTATAQNVATVPVGGNPIGVAVTPDDAFAYVANFSTPGSVSVIATNTPTPTATGATLATPQACNAAGNWQNLSGVTISGTNNNTVTKSGAGIGNAQSVASIPANAAGWFEMMVTSASFGTYNVFGLAATNAAAHYTNIDFGFDIAFGVLGVMESGTIRRGSLTVGAGDKLRVNRAADGTITYFHEPSRSSLWTLLWTSASISTGALYAAVVPNGAGVQCSEVYLEQETCSTPTPTSTATTTPTPTATATETPTPTCAGDCNGDGHVTVDEILTMVNIALGNAPLAECEAGDGNGDHQITVDEILTAVNFALNGCPSPG